MAIVTFQNLLDSPSNFQRIENEFLFDCVLKYALQQEDTIMKTILHERISISVNGEVVEPGEWANKIVNADDEVIIHPVLGRGKIGAFLMIIAAVALFAIVKLPVFGLVGTKAATIMKGAALSLALGGISNLLFQPKLPNLNFRTEGSDSQTYNWSGIRTTATTDTSISLIYGTHLVGGNLISAFTESVGSDNYLNMLIALGEGPIDGICKYNSENEICLTSDPESSLYEDPAIYLDDQPISQYTDIDWWYRVGSSSESPSDSWAVDKFYRIGDTTTNSSVDYFCIGDHTSAEANEPGSGVAWEDYWESVDTIYCPFLQNHISEFDGAKSQNQIESVITNVSTNYTTTKDVDGLIVQVRSPALYNTKEETGQIQTYHVDYTIEYKKASDPTYTDYEVNTYEPEVSGTNPNIIGSISYIYSNTIYDEKASGVYSAEEYTIEINYVEDAYRTYTLYNYNFEKSNDDPYTTVKEKIANRKLNYTVTDTKGNVTNYNNVIFTGFHTKKIILGPFRFNFDPNIQVGDTATIKSVSTGKPSSTIRISGKTKNTTWQTLKLLFDERDTYDIRITRDGVPSDSMYVEDTLYLSSITEVVNGEFIYPYTALLGFRIKATDQLAGSPPNVTALVRGLKISVPDIEVLSSSKKVRFEEAIWDGTEWKDDYGSGSVLTWDDSSLRSEEYSDTAILCVQDLMLNKRYGLGEYLDSTDIYQSRLAETIQDCNFKYLPYKGVVNLFSWIDTPSRWSYHRYNRVSPSQTITVTDDSTTGTITVSASDSSAGIALIGLYLGTSLSTEREYVFKFTLAINTPGVSSISLGYENPATLVRRYLHRPEFIKVWISASAGNFSHTFTPTKTGYFYYVLQFWSPTGLGEFEISNIELYTTTDKHTKYHSWNGVLDSSQAAVTALLEMCSTFRCWPIWYNGKFNFVIDKDETVVHYLSKGNTTSFEQTFLGVSEIPSRLISQFTDKSIRYNLRSLKAISDDTTLNKLNVNNIGLRGITDVDRAIRETKFNLNKVINCTHAVTVRCGQEHLHATAGDLVAIQDDLPMWGHGGRLLDYNSTAVTIDSAYEFTGINTASFLINYQTQDNNYVTATIDVNYPDNEGSTLQVIPLKSFPETPGADAVYQLGQQGILTKPFRLMSVQRVGEGEVEFQAVNHVASVYDEDAGIFISKIRYTPEISPLLIRPAIPVSVEVKRLSPEAGIGFLFHAEPGDTLTSDITIYMSEGEGSFTFVEIAKINMNTKEAQYINNSLSTVEGANIYNFRFVAFSPVGKRSFPADVTDVKLEQVNYVVDAPKGIRVQGQQPNYQDNNSCHLFDGRDLTVEWNPAGVNTFHSEIVRGYKINVYKNSYTKSNLVRTSVVSGTTWTYLLSDNISDGDGTPFSTFILEFFTLSVGNSESATPRLFKVRNSSPSTVANLSAHGITGGVKFEWDQNTETDLKGYEYQLKVGSGAYGDTTLITDNSFVRILASSEIATDGSRSNVAIKVRSKDLYNQISAFETTNLNANMISDDIFILFGTKSEGTGYVASLYDGVLTSGGVNIT